MHRRQISTVITDLDNTLYDWVEMWFRSFSAMLAKVLEEVEPKGISRDRLISEIRSIHQRHGTSEYAFLLEEIPCLKAAFPENTVLDRFGDAIHSYRKARKEYLRLYPGVLQTLRALKAEGVLIVGYTESMAFYTNYRMRMLELDGLVDYLYSPQDHDLPAGLNLEQIRKYPSEHYQLRFTEHRYTPAGELKPNPALLNSIIDDVGANKAECIYIGDSLMKDVLMAKDARVIDVHADYGAAQHRDEYQLLREVSHWTDEDVARERQLQQRQVYPTHVLEGSLSEILAIFHFTGFQSHLKDSNIKAKIEIWKKFIDVQQHFNDLEMRIRNFAVTILGALFGAAGLALSRDVSINLGSLTVPLGLFFMISALFTWAGFWFMDRHWYHRLLYGSVEHGRKIEESIRLVVPEVALTESIGKASPVHLLGFTIKSKTKIDIFYGIGAAAIVVALWALIPHLPDRQPPALAASPSRDIRSPPDARPAADPAL